MVPLKLLAAKQRRLTLLLGWLVLAMASPQAAPAAAALEAAAIPATRLRIVGGLGSLNQYTRLEEPFWRFALPALTAGRVQADIAPYDRAGIRGQDMLRLLQQGVVSFGTAPLNLAGAEDALLVAADLPGLNPDIATLHRSVAAFRPTLAAQLRERHGLELLAVYAYPAQVVFCKQPFATLADLRGRRVRVAGTALADVAESLGAVPVLMPLAETVPQMRAGMLDCAITGAMSGNTLGLHEITSHPHPLALSWGLSLFAANGAAWSALSPDLRRLLKQRLPQLERDIWAAADRETTEGAACNIGAPACQTGRAGQMRPVPPHSADRARLHELLGQTTLPRWLARCGAGCAEVWNSTLAGPAGIRAAPGTPAARATRAASATRAGPAIPEPAATR
jgi:TRAP-type C4-dicarboxylate transport system substrate-binding protein